MPNTDNPLEKQWSELQVRLSHMHKLICAFHALHDSKTLSGEKGKPGRPDLQLQLALYRQECVRIHYALIALNQRFRTQRATTFGEGVVPDNGAGCG